MELIIVSPRTIKFAAIMSRELITLLRGLDASNRCCMQRRLCPSAELDSTMCSTPRERQVQNQYNVSVTERAHVTLFNKNQSSEIKRVVVDGLRS